jgi:NADH dehydrogenase
VLLGEVQAIDTQNHCVKTEDDSIPYDTLIVATGAAHSYFGHDEWKEFAPGLKTTEDAIEMRHRIFYAFEAAEKAKTEEERRAWMTFVIVGAGPTGCELAGALGELANDTLKEDFRQIYTKDAGILLVEGSDRVLPPFPEDLSANAEMSLRSLGVKVIKNTFVTNVTKDGATLKSKDGEKFIPAKTILWAAGVQSSPLGKVLAEQTGCALDKIGRVIVNPDLSIPNASNIFVIGDLANFSHQDGKPLPGVAPVAMQQGKYAAQLIKKRLQRGNLEPFHYKDHGIMAVIGRAAAVANIPGMKLTGYPAWFAWLLIHLINLVEYENRLLVAIQWAWSYFTFNRGARLITGDTPKKE